MGEGLDLFDGIAAELFADHLKFFVQARGAEDRIGFKFLHEGHQAQPRGLCIAVTCQLGRSTGCQRSGRLSGQAHVLQANDFGLVHRNATGQLAKIFAKSDLVNKLFGLTEFLLRLQSLGPALHLLETLHIGGQPRKTMRCGLMIFNQRVLDPAISADHVAQAHARSLADRLSRRQSLGGEGEQIWKNYRSRHVHILFLRSRVNA